MTGKIITIEGGDGTGKETQSKLLEERLVRAGYPVKRFSFPMYETYWGKIVYEHLHGKHGGLKELNPYKMSPLFAFNRLEAVPEILKALADGMIVINDRFVEANALHQAAKLTGQARVEMAEFIFDYEYGKLGIPKSDLVYFMELDPDHSAKAMSDQGRILDIHESDIGYQRAVRETGLELAERYGWEVIHCLDENNNRISIQDMSDILFSKTLEYLK